jgi:hypothetical protein
MLKRLVEDKRITVKVADLRIRVSVLVAVVKNFLILAHISTHGTISCQP